MPPLDTTKSSLQQIGNYDIILKIAEGGMGAVYKGQHRQSRDLVAIKVLPPGTAKNPVLLQRFEREFKAASQLNHPNIVKAIEYCGTGPSPFLVMEFVDGESLGQRIERDGAIAEDLAIRLIAQVCQGLHRAHKTNLIHRDVKPDNIMVTPDGVAKLTDLGLVKDAEDELNLTRTGRGLGTPHFMAPEQFRNAKNADIRCDIYSLGATLYMMVTGELPFGKVGPLDCWMKKIRNDYIPPRQLNPNISDRVDWAIRRSMSGDADQRPNSCREFIEDVTGVTIRSQAIPNDQSSKLSDVWYLVYKDDMGETHTVKGTTDGIRRALKENLMGDAHNIRACRTKSGPFQPLKSYTEFRDLVVEPAPMPSATTGTALESSTPTPTPTRSKKTPSSGKWTPAEAAQKSKTGSDEAVVNLDVLPQRDISNDLTALSVSGKNLDLARSRLPHIRMTRERPRGLTVMIWIMMLMIALGTSVAAAILLPRIL